LIFNKSNKLKDVYLDCGSNIGQGFEHFRKIYKKNFDYILFDPNPNCFKILQSKYSNQDNIKIFNNAIYIDDSVKVFSFISDTDFGGSLIKEHNSGYSSDEYLNKTFGTTQFKNIKVKCINIISLISDLKTKYRNIIIKFDIESAEYDVLEKMIETGTIKDVKKIHCEFHTSFMDEKDKHLTVPREENIIKYCKDNRINLERWDQ